MRIIISKYFGIPFESVELVNEKGEDLNDHQAIAREVLDFNNITYRVKQTLSKDEQIGDFAKVQDPVIKMFPFSINEPTWA